MTDALQFRPVGNTVVIYDGADPEPQGHVEVLRIFVGTKARSVWVAEKIAAILNDAGIIEAVKEEPET